MAFETELALTRSRIRLGAGAPSTMNFDMNDLSMTPISSLTARCSIRLYFEMTAGGPEPLLYSGEPAPSRAVIHLGISHPLLTPK